ncbi:MAG: hypothetical protein NZ952_02055 [Candidatus Bathyarchaeota archaeon]|nr:hypothetical protein [Candidatus Bathyarchaeota archaeon]
MEAKPRGISRKASYAIKMKRAVHLLFYKKHRDPGVKGWELRKALGSEYPRVLNLLDSYLEKLDLKVKTVFEDEITNPENPTLEQLDKARFYVTLRGTLTPKETKMVGWRIDDIAALAVSLGYIISKGGKAPRKEVEDFLAVKLPKWRVDINLNRFIRLGYIYEDENTTLYLGWRTRAEVDQGRLVDLLLQSESKVKNDAHDN